MVKCDSCERYKTHTLHECVGVVLEMFATCSCLCEKTDEVRQAMDAYGKGNKLGISMEDAYRNLSDAINDAAKKFTLFGSQVGTNTNSGSWSHRGTYSSNT